MNWNGSLSGRKYRTKNSEAMPEKLKKIRNYYCGLIRPHHIQYLGFNMNRALFCARMRVHLQKCCKARSVFSLFLTAHIHSMQFGIKFNKLLEKSCLPSDCTVCRTVYSLFTNQINKYCDFVWPYWFVAVVVVQHKRKN